jgi:glutamate N-acetyltransferase / amino-acid N-acetyltransferase
VAVKWPAGVRSAGVASGIKPEGSDLGVILADAPVTWAGTFTKNAAAAAPVLWSRDRLGAKVRALVVNSGNANACTGTPGREAVLATAAAAASAIGCEPEEVLVASTGPIGVQLPLGKLVDALPSVLEVAGDDIDAFSASILTTDTHPKSSHAVVGEATIVGVAKGAAMIAPNMATMLAFLVTDARIDDGDLNSHLRTAVGRSFDRISVDACESTNDSVYLLTTGAVDVDGDAFAAALNSVCKDLAEQIVRDAEGGTKVIRIQVEGAASEAEAVSLGKAVAASDLWRAAANGKDPNWGRVASALGSVARDLDMGSLEISIGPELVFSKGEPCGSLDVAAKAMGEDEFALRCVVGEGAGSAEVLSADLSTDYVALNAEGTT